MSASAIEIRPEALHGLSFPMPSPQLIRRLAVNLSHTMQTSDSMCRASDDAKKFFDVDENPLHMEMAHTCYVSMAVEAGCMPIELVKANLK